MPLSLSLSRSPCACVAFLADRRVVYVVGDHTRVAGALHVPPGACGRAPTPSLCYDVTKPSGYLARACACARTRVPVLRYRFRIRQSRKCRLETLSCSPTTRVLQATPRGLAAVRAKQPTTLSVCFIDTRCDNSCVLTTLIGWLVSFSRAAIRLHTHTAYYPPGQQSSSIWNNPQRYDMPPDEQAGSAGTSGGSMPGYASPNFHYQVPPTNTPYSTTPVYQTDNMLLNDGEQ